MRLRKATWAIFIWTGWMLLWNFLELTSLETDYGLLGMVFSWSIVLISMFFIWFIGFVILAIIWFLSRPKQNTAIYGPQGQQMMVTEKEAKKRVEREGWMYQPPQPYTAQQPYPPRQSGPPPGGQSPQGGQPQG